MIKCPGCGHPKDWHARRIDRCITYNGDNLACTCTRGYASIQPTWWYRLTHRLIRKAS